MAFNYNPGLILDRDLFAACEHEAENDSKMLNYEALGNKFDTILFALTQLINAIDSRAIAMESWMKPSEILLIKLCLHSSSIKQLLSPVPLIKSEDGEIVCIQDINSVYVLCRAQIECYLTFYYFILSPQSSEEGKFKQLLNELSGYSNRQTYDCTLPELLEKKQSEAAEIAALRQKIANNSYYQQLSAKEKRKVDDVKPKAKLLGWEKLLESTRMKKEFLVSRWKLYSNFAHSEFIGTMQLGSYLRNNGDMKKTLYHTQEAVIMVLCVAITELLNLFPQLVEDYEKILSIEDRTYIYGWSRMGLRDGL